MHNFNFRSATAIAAVALSRVCLDSVEIQKGSSSPSPAQGIVLVLVIHRDPKSNKIVPRSRQEGIPRRPERAEIARLQADMNKTKEMLARVHDKPIWRRVVDRFKAKQHALINFLAASMAYILAHRLHLQMKANEELREKVETETATTFELRSLLRSLVTEEFARDAVAQSQAAQATNGASQDGNANVNANDTTKSKTTKSSGWFWPTHEGSSALSSSARDTLAVSLRQTLEARIGDERLEDADRKQKNLQDIWKENEQRIENTDEGLAALAAALAAEEPNTNDAASTGTSTDATKASTKKRVFDM